MTPEELKNLAMQAFGASVGVVSGQQRTVSVTENILVGRDRADVIVIVFDSNESICVSSSDPRTTAAVLSHALDNADEALVDEVLKQTEE